MTPTNSCTIYIEAKRTLDHSNGQIEYQIPNLPYFVYSMKAEGTRKLLTLYQQDVLAFTT